MSKPTTVAALARTIKRNPAATRPINALRRICALILDDLGQWRDRCHEASLALVQDKRFPASARVARGYHPDVKSQHSWVALGDPYDLDTVIIDPTLRFHLDGRPGIVIGQRRPGSGHSIFQHRLRNDGDIWDYGRPDPGAFKGEPEQIKPPLGGWSPKARSFLAALGPMPHHAWGHLVSNFPFGGWPAAEIVEAMANTPTMSALIPIDALGMLTNRNPGKLYMRGPERKG